MKQKYVYALIFGIPGIVISAFAALFVGGAMAGFFWIFIFGDNEWPSWSGIPIIAVSIIVFTIVLSLIVRAGFSVGKKREVQNMPIQKIHLFLSVMIVVLLVFLVFVYQRGHVLKEPPHKICRDMCIQNGYDGNGTSMSPIDSGKRICSCWNNTTKKYDEVGNIE